FVPVGTGVWSGGQGARPIRSRSVGLPLFHAGFGQGLDRGRDSPVRESTYPAIFRALPEIPRAPRRRRTGMGFRRTSALGGNGTCAALRTRRRVMATISRFSGTVPWSY